MAGQAAAAGTTEGFAQGTFDELGTPLREVTFVVVDLETTGGSPADCRITEIGAVKVRAGEVVGEFQTLVHPGEPIPPFIAVLTGITDAMVASAPPLEAALPAFLEFAGAGCVLVAHNAPFDVGFLKAACAETARPWPGWTVVDTARLARSVVSRDEARDCRLATLAQLFRSATTPVHRALADARATVDVLHGLLERVGSLGVHSVEELATFTARVPAQLRRKRHLAEPLPHAPGVYVFRDAQGTPLYVGTSRDLRNRVRTYFTASETRTRMAEMVGLAESVTAVVCPTTVEAEVRELRMIAEHKPRYNRRSRHPERVVWLKLTNEAFPRLSLVRQVRDDGGAYLGPFGGRRSAESAMHALHEAVPLRQCSDRLSRAGRGSACALAEMGRCGAPCEGRESVDAYDAHVRAVRDAFGGDLRPVAQTLVRRIETLAQAQRFEDAAFARDRFAALVRAAARAQRLLGLSGCAEVVAARRRDDGGWELVCVRWGRLAGSSVAPRGTDPRAAVDALVATAEAVQPTLPGRWPTPAASAAETERVLDWLERPGTRLVRLEGTWSSPAFGAGSVRAWLEGTTGPAASGPAPSGSAPSGSAPSGSAPSGGKGGGAARTRGTGLHAPSEDRRGLRPSHQPPGVTAALARA